MNKTRLEAFSDGVLAIIITIMVLEIHVPETADCAAFLGLLPTLTGYLLSFVFVGIYWNNHHHLLHTADKVNGAMMWANLMLLFWLSLVPFATAWMDKSHFAPFSMAAYAVLLLLCGTSFDILRRIILRSVSENDRIKSVLNKLDFKSIFSIVCYSIAIPAAYWHKYISISLFVVVAIVWFIPSRAIEKGLEESDHNAGHH